jgi:hypothetical protein
MGACPGALSSSAHLVRWAAPRVSLWRLYERGWLENRPHGALGSTPKPRSMLRESSPPGSICRDCSSYVHRGPSSGGAPSSSYRPGRSRWSPSTSIRSRVPAPSGKSQLGRPRGRGQRRGRLKSSCASCHSQRVDGPSSDELECTTGGGMACGVAARAGTLQPNRSPHPSGEGPARACGSLERGAIPSSHSRFARRRLIYASTRRLHRSSRHSP